MASILRCDHLRRHKAPNAFANERAELIHVSEQLSSLDHHISELNTLRNTLHLRTLQLHNLLSPIYVFPTEILSYIFQLAGGPESHSRSRFDDYWGCLRQALVLSSVSSHFRHVVFGTPELWDKIPLRLAEGNPIDKVSSLLQHCIIRAPNITVCAYDELHYNGGRDLDSVIETLFTCDVMRKVKGFEVWSLTNVPLWLSKFNSTFFPMIESLIMTCPPQHLSAFDIGTLNNLTRLNISCGLLDVLAITVPPSVQYLSIGNVSENVFVSLLYQCPNLVECYAESTNELDGPSFTEPLILNHLKRLRTNTIYAFAMSSSLQYLQLPSLEFLDLNHFTGYSLENVSLCCSVSATLTSLAISTHIGMLDYDDLYQLFRSTFPKLKVLQFTSIGLADLLNVIHALSPLDGEYNNPRPLHLPALESITLCSSRLEHEARSVLDSLKNWWSGAALHLHLELEGVGDSNTSDIVWTPALKEEFRLIKGSRHIEMIWDYRKI